ncbi:MAG: hypothetical protein KY393_04250 [Actinobacteria bacterium]|nr:hypothetical protein [Actinomycetota bacterium]
MSARLERFFVQAFGLILLLKAVDLVVRLLPLEGPLLTGLLVVPWVLASSLLVCRRLETFACLVIVAIVAAALLIVGQPIHNQHLYLIASIATILAIFRRPERKIALRAQLSINHVWICRLG